jgi:uncharacterized protein YjcR
MAKKPKTEIEKTKEQALKLYLESDGEMSPGEIAAKVKTRPNVIGAWIAKEGWRNRLTGKPQERTGIEKPKAQTKSKRAGKTRLLRKPETFDKALQMFRESGGKISNTAISEALGIGMATVSKWKAMPEWTMGTEQAGKAEEKLPVAVETKQDLKPVAIDKEIIFEALQRIDKTLDEQIHESIGLKTEIRFLVELIKRGD